MLQGGYTHFVYGPCAEGTPLEQVRRMRSLPRSDGCSSPSRCSFPSSSSGPSRWCCASRGAEAPSPPSPPCQPARVS
jgi:hypothetical protein